MQGAFGRVGQAPERPLEFDETVPMAFDELEPRSGQQRAKPFRTVAVQAKPVAALDRLAEPEAIELGAQASRGPKVVGEPELCRPRHDERAAGLQQLSKLRKERGLVDLVLEEPE